MHQPLNLESVSKGLREVFVHSGAITAIPDDLVTAINSLFASVVFHLFTIFYGYCTAWCHTWRCQLKHTELLECSWSWEKSCRLECLLWGICVHYVIHGYSYLLDILWNELTRWVSFLANVFLFRKAWNLTFLAKHLKNEWFLCLETEYVLMGKIPFDTFFATRACMSMRTIVWKQKTSRATWN